MLNLTFSPQDQPRFSHAARVYYNAGNRDITFVTDSNFYYAANYWDDGSRRFYQILDREELDPTRFPHPDRGDIEIPKGHCILEHKVSQGRSWIYVYLREDEPDPSISKAAEPVELDPHERIVLAYTAGLKSSYGGVKNLRFTRAREGTGITQELWDEAVGRCIAKNWLTTRKAITPSGRNAIGLVRPETIERELREQARRAG